MGILNITPDSFSDGGRYVTPEAIRARLHEIAEHGAAICDVGAESTRPGAEAVPADEQLRRLQPVFDVLADGSPIPISIDTSSARVAERALDHGVEMVNDVTAGRGDPDLLPLVADRGCDVCLMHMQGEPRTMQEAPHYDDVVTDVARFLTQRMEAAMQAGVRDTALLIDPGIGFGKTLKDNLALIAGLGVIARIGAPIVLGVSRKRMFGDLLSRDVDERLPASLAAGLRGVADGARVLRVHDVRETVDALRVWTAIDEEA